MATLDTTLFAWSLKTRYLPDGVKVLAYENHPFYAMVPKDESFLGKNKVFGVLYSDINAGGSVTFATALAGKGGNKGEAFTVTRKKDYAVCSIDNETLEAAMGDENALLEAFEGVMNSAIRTVGNSIARKLYGDASGQIGTISSIGSNVITLTDPEDASNFEVGMDLVFAASTSAALRDSGNTGNVTDVDRDAGTVTIASTPSGVVANDVIFREGDYVSASDRICMAGLSGWIPNTVTSASWFGVDRTSDTIRLGGCRIDGTGLPVDEALTKLVVRCAREGARTSAIFVSHARYEELLNLLGTKAQYTEFKVGEIAFGGVSVQTAAGPVKVYPDIDCPGTKAFAVDFRGMKFCSLGPAPKLLTYKGNGMLFEYNADGLELRVGAYGNLLVTAPGWQGVCYNFGQ